LEIIISIVAIAAIIWLFLRHNTKSGKRAVGAHLYLSALEEGLAQHDAGRKAEAGMAAPSKTAIHRTYERLQRDHNGKARLLVKAAEQKGFKG
jgi:hypothetical protein